MKIIKVIVDKLPDSCDNCDYLYFDGKPVAYPICGALLREHDKIEEIFVNDKLPDWCPLVLEEENIKQVLNGLDGEPKRYLYKESEE